MSRENWCDWHVLVVEHSDDDREVTVMHPGCGFAVTVSHDAVQYEHYCQIQWEIDNAGFDTLLDGHGDGWYRARMRHFTSRYGLEFSEIDVEYEVEPLGLPARIVVAHPEGET